MIGSQRHVVCKRSKPPPSTADAACIAINDVTQDRYLCKDQGKVHWLPMVEWLAHALARRCGLLVPDCYLIELEASPGQYMFGSKWEGGGEQWYQDIVAAVSNPKEFSAILAFDLLIHNVDRHVNNYLYLMLAGDIVVKAMDHSRCMWFSGWPWPNPPPDKSTATIRNIGYWTAQAAWDQATAHGVIDAWRKISVQEVESILDSLPQDWVAATMRAELLSWWGSPEWTDRCDQVEGVLI